MVLKFFTVLMLGFSMVSCANEPSATKTDGEQTINTTNNDESKVEEIGQDSIAIQNYTDTSYFSIVQNYIRKVGEHSRVDVSSAQGGGLWVDYYIIHIDDWRITVDHSKRIYFTKGGYHHGNVLFENDKIQVEKNYVGPNDDIDLIEEVEKPIWQLYTKLVDQAVNYKE